MPLSALDPISARPRGGVTKVELIPASEYAGVAATAAAVYATQNEVGTALAASAAGALWPFREDRAHYREQTEDGTTLSPLVRHTLEMDVPATAATRRLLGELAATSAREGLVAVVTMASGERIAAGWSTRFGTLYPLRLTAAKALSGHSPADYPTISVILESVDGDPSAAV